METVEIFSILENFGAEIFLCAFAVCAACFCIKKFFPRIPDKAETGIRIVLSAVFCSAFICLKKGDFATLFERTTTVFGVSYAVCNFFRGGNARDPVFDLLSLFVPENEIDGVKEKIGECKTAKDVAAVLSDYASGFSSDGLNAFSETLYFAANGIYPQKTL